MRFTEASRDNLIRANYKPGKVQRVVQEFVDSGMDCVEVTYEDGEYSNPYSCTAALRVSAKSMKLTDTVEVETANGRCYMYRKDVRND